MSKSPPLKFPVIGDSFGDYAHNARSSLVSEVRSPASKYHSTKSFTQSMRGNRGFNR